VTDPSFETRLHAALRDAGMRGVPRDFSVASVHQELPRATMQQIDAFLRVLDRVTTRPAWQDHVTLAAPEIARQRRRETCFFSAWDFHVPSERPDQWQLIECNDNGSGFLFASLLDRLYCELAGLDAVPARLEAPAPHAELTLRIARMIDREAGAPPRGLLLVLDDPGSLEHGKFKDELLLLRDLCRSAGWRAELGAPAETIWDGDHLRLGGEPTPISFVVNRSTDFFFAADAFSALRAAYSARRVLVVPNPFTYATRSDKRLLELLSSSTRDDALGITPNERAILRDHVPDTRVLAPDNVEELARHREGYFFKPCHGFASHGLLTGAEVGLTRLRRILKKGEPYVAQRSAPKSRIDLGDGVSLWTDLRVWAYRGERFLLSGRASIRPDGIDLSPPGGWLATYARA
jgi:hypothetical protein